MPNEISDYDKYEIPNDGSFLKLEAGDNKIRIASKPYEVAFYQTSKKGEKYSTQSLRTKEEVEQAVREGKKVKYKYAYLAFSRKDNKLYVFEAPVAIFRLIVNFARNPEYGDPQKYDITVNKQGEGLGTTYQVIPSRKSTPLTPEEESLVALSNHLIESTYAPTE